MGSRYCLFLCYGSEKPLCGPLYGAKRGIRDSCTGGGRFAFQITISSSTMELAGIWCTIDGILCAYSTQQTKQGQHGELRVKQGLWTVQQCARESAGIAI